MAAPAHTDGESGLTYHFSREYPLHLWTAGADWLLKPLVDHDDTEGVRDPRTTALLAEVALFYEDFLTRTDADDHLVVVPSYSPENRPANASWGAVNAAMDLSAARHALLTAADHHPDDPERADRWRALADRLPPHRINADGALAEWAWPGLDDTYDHRHLSHLYGVWPLDEINPYDTPDLAAAAYRALQLRGAENDSAHGHLHHALIAARLRDGERVTHALGQVLDGDFFHASLMSAHYPGTERLQRGRRPRPARRAHRGAHPVDPRPAGPPARAPRGLPHRPTPRRTDAVRRGGRPRLGTGAGPGRRTPHPQPSDRPQNFLRRTHARSRRRRGPRPRPGAAVTAPRNSATENSTPPTPAFPPTHGRNTPWQHAPAPLSRITKVLLAPALALGATVGLASAPASAAVWNSCDQWGNTSLNGYTLYNNIWGSGAGSQCIWANSGTNWGV